MAESKKLDEVHKGGIQAPDVLSLQDAPAAVLSEDTLDPVYAAKAKVLNKAIQDIGMGRYQWQVRRTKFRFTVAFHQCIIVRGKGRLGKLCTKWIGKACRVLSGCTIPSPCTRLFRKDDV